MIESMYDAVLNNSLLRFYADLLLQFCVFLLHSVGLIITSTIKSAVFSARYGDHSFQAKYRLRLAISVNWTISISTSTSLRVRAPWQHNRRAGVPDSHISMSTLRSCNISKCTHFPVHFPVPVCACGKCRWLCRNMRLEHSSIYRSRVFRVLRPFCLAFICCLSGGT